MNRRFNYTGRMKLVRDAVRIRVIEDPAGGAASFTADISALRGLGLPSTSQLIIEPYVRQSSMRFDCGTLADLSVPVDTRMTEVDRGEVVQFRIKVVDTIEKPGRILALASQVRPTDETDDDDRRPILPIHYMDLGEAVWRLQVGSSESPVLALNSRIAELPSRIDDDALLRGAIFSAAIRETMRVLLSEDVDEDTEWVRDWREFAESLLGEAIPDDALEPDKSSELIERTVEEFCNREKWATATQSSPVITEADYE